MSFAGIDISALCGFGSGTPPKGQVANLVDPPTLASVSWGITVSMTAWALLFTMARVYVNFRKLRASDYFVIIAMVLDIGYSASVLSLNKWARHIWDIPVCWMTGTYMKRLFAAAMMYGPTIYFAKSSLLLLYLQFFAVQRPIRIATWVGLVAVGLCYWSNIPIEAPFLAPWPGETWQDVVLSGRPQKISPWGFVQGPLNVVIDLYTFILPFPILAKLKLSPRRRLELLIIFSTAFLGVVVSVVALVYRVRLNYTEDVTWAQMCVDMCIVLENNISIVVSCMPAFAVFIKKNVSDTSFFKSLRSALMPSGGKSAASASTRKKRMIVTFGGGSDRQKLQNKDDDIRFDSYLELDDVSRTKRDSENVPPHQPEMQWTGPATSVTPLPQAAHHMPDQGIIRTTEVTQQFYPASAHEVRGQAF